MIRKLSYILIVTLISFLACSDKPNASKQNTTIDDLEKALSYNKAEVAQVPDVCFEHQSREEKFSCLYERFNYESTLCSKLEVLVREKGLMQKIKDDFYVPQIGGKKALIILLNGSLRDDSSVRYLVTHPAYFEIEVDYHYSPLGAVYIAETDIYCAPTIKRLHELESLGRSDLVWHAREKWLDHALKQIHWPWDEMGGPETKFFVAFERVKQVYNSEEDKKRLQQFINKAEKFFFQTAESENIEGYAGKTKEQHLETLRQWVAQIRRGL